ncbi:MAG: ABC transporter substrate-binding protein, partial [Actinomycetota bacterium]|nr:ABC transporter substrate-binding protein [Actinomycetota bacterium]
MAALVVVGTLVLGACGDDADPGTSGSEPTGQSVADGGAAALEGTVRLGYFPNVTHAPALVGMAQGTFTEALGDGVDLKSFTFNAGTEAVEAMLSESLDITLIGPSPAINAFSRSNGEAIRIVAGSTSGGAYLVVKPEITSVEQLAGTTLATPSLGNTQDVALRAWLQESGLEATPEGGGDVSILPQSNSTTLESFISGAIDGAWVPEPWATRLIEEGGGTVLVDERDLWPDTGGEYVTTHVIVRTEFLGDHPDLAKAVLVGLADAVDLINADSAAAQADVVAQITEITGSAPSADVIAAGFANLTFTLDPIAASLQKSADDAVSVGLLEAVELDGIYDLTLLDEILTER